MTDWSRHFMQPEAMAATSRRFEPGMQFELQGQRYRVGTGDKGAVDLVLEWMTPYGWRRVPMAALALMFEFLVENEAALRPHRPHWRNEAEAHLLQYLRAAVRVGWEEADRQMVQVPRERDEARRRWME